MALLLREPEADRVHVLSTIDANTKMFLDASLPKLGSLGHQGAAQLLAAFDGPSLLADDARAGRRDRQDLTERLRMVAIHVGVVLNTLWELYELERPDPSEQARIALNAITLEELKKFGL